MHKSKQDYMRGVIAAKYNEVHEPSVSGHVWCGDKAIRDYYERIDSMAREFAKPFYNSKQWQEIREYILMRDKYLCQKCGSPAEEVHHKIKLTPENMDDPKITMGEDNLISLCRDCHFKEHREDRNVQTDVAEGFYFDDQGKLQKL